MAAAVAEVDGYFTHAKISDDSGFSAKGEGGGVRGRVNLPMTGLFATGEYQMNKLKDDTFGSKADFNDTRLGVGGEMSAGPVSVLARAEYIHTSIDPDVGTKDNDDGFGAHVGVDAGIGIAGVYGSAGYVKLADAKGPELLVGARVSVLPLVSLFGEYRYTKLNDSTGAIGASDAKLDDIRVGVKVGF